MTFKLAELHASEGYARWLGIVSRFAVASFGQWRVQGAGNALCYLLQFWTMLVGSTAPTTHVAHKVGDHVMPVLESFLNGRLAAAGACAAAEVGGPDDCGGAASPVEHGELSSDARQQARFESNNRIHFSCLLAPHACPTHACAAR